MSVAQTQTGVGRSRLRAANGLRDRAIEVANTLGAKLHAQHGGLPSGKPGLLAAVMGGLACAMARARGLDDPPWLPREAGPIGDIAASFEDHGLAHTPVRQLGSIYETLLGMEPAAGSVRGSFALAPASRERRAAGAFYTPEPLVEYLLGTALDPVIDAALHQPDSDPERALLDIRICDPACGSGHFLLVAAHRLAARLAGLRCRSGELTIDDHRHALRAVVTHCIYGVDIDPTAVALCRAVLWIEAGGGATTGNIRVGDALHGGPLGAASREDADRWCNERTACSRVFFHWRHEFPEVFERGAAKGFDVILGNPPFLNQLATSTAADRSLAALLRDLTGGAVSGYADTAAAFLARSIDLCRPGGRVGLVQPQSLLAAKDAGPVRAAALRRGSLAAIWVSRGHLFDALVQTCALTIEIAGPRRREVLRSAGPSFDPLPPADVDMDELARQPTWGPLVAIASGVPEVVVRSPRTIGDLATATADFRDQYYGLDGFLIEDADLDAPHEADYPPIITSGLIDLADLRWGRAPTRLLKRRWTAPRIDRRRMEREGTLGPWLDARLIPKLLLATQTRVLEVLADPEGRLAPSTPVISVMPRDSDDLWRIAAAIASPVAVAEAARLYSGTALSAGAIKLSAKQVCRLPLPTDEHAWSAAADLFRRAQVAEEPARQRLLTEFAGAGINAFNIAGADAAGLQRWWLDRLQRPGRDRGAPIG